MPEQEQITERRSKQAFFTGGGLLLFSTLLPWARTPAGATLGITSLDGVFLAFLVTSLLLYTVLRTYTYRATLVIGGVVVFFAIADIIDPVPVSTLGVETYDSFVSPGAGVYIALLAGVVLVGSALLQRRSE